MHKRIKLLASLGMIAALAGCNSVDALTPQVDVGGGTFRSPPVTQTDLDSMSRQNAYTTPQATGPVESTPLASTQQSFNQGADGTLMAPENSQYTDPAGSLDAQAGRLQQGDIPAQARGNATRSDLAAPQETTSLDNGPAQEQASAPIDTPEESAEVQVPQKQAAIAPTATAGTIRFLPIIGAPVEAVTPLSKQLGAEARANGLTIKGGSDPTSQHILKGYFSAFKDNSTTTIVYVWDVLDGAGNRLHRIQGQDTVDASAPDLWSAVPAQTMQTIATKTIGEYLDWRARNAG